jgi:2-polyprenyl-3-methyl-5-hydroxy-6-metoxy-1,4-benzoquinol methylase
MFFDTFWQKTWDKRASDHDILVSGGRVVHGTWKTQIDHITNDLNKTMKFTDDDILLDVGCSGGKIIEAIAPQVKTAIGIDYSQTTIFAAQKAKYTQDSIIFLPANATSLPFRDNSFSKLICYSVLIYLNSMKKVEQAIDEFKRVLKDNGKIFIGDVLIKDRKPSFWSLDLLKAQAGKKDILHYLKMNVGMHLGMMLWVDLDRLQRFMESRNLRVTRLDQNTSYPLSSMMCDLFIEVEK